MKNTKAPKMPLSQLVKRIPFRVELHINMSDVHSTLHKNKRLKIVCKTHVYFENGRPTGKSERCFYEDNPDSLAFNTLSELLKADKGIKEKAHKLYGKKQQGKKTKHFPRKECV